MTAITFTEFDGGLDITRGKAVAGANQLRQLTNAYITTGKAIQKRPGLVKVADVPGTVGLAGVGNSLKVFTADPFNVPYFGAPIDVETIANPRGGNPPGALQQVLFAKPFLGYLYVVAQFAGDVDAAWHFYQDWHPGGRATWRPNIAYAVGDVVVAHNQAQPAGCVMQCTGAGTSAANEPAWLPGFSKVGDTLVDNTVTWRLMTTQIEDVNDPNGVIDIVDNNAGVAYLLAQVVATQSAFAANASGAAVRVSGAAGTAFSYAASAANGGSVDDQSLTASLVQNARAGVAEVRASMTVYLLPYNYYPSYNSYYGFGAQPSGSYGTVYTGQIASIKVAGAEILGTTLTVGFDSYGDFSSNYATQLVNQINAYQNLYTAAVSGGHSIRLTAAPGTGSAPNGRTVSVTPTYESGHPTLEFDLSGPFAGGVDAVVALRQIVRFTVGGTFEPNDTFTLTLNGDDYRVPASTSGTKSVAFSAQKVFAIAGDTVKFCATNKPRDWTADKDAGFLPTGIQSASNGDALALGQFRKYLAVLLQGSVQVWQTDPDPAQMRLYDTIEGIGTRYPRAVGNLSGDVYILSDIGVRSITLLTQTANLKDYDVGTPVNALIVQSLADNPGVTPIAAYYPKGGQFWLAVGKTVWVYTYSRTAKLSAWSRYEFSAAIDSMSVAGGELYLRCGDGVYRVDEQAGDDDGKVFEVAVALPYMDLKKPGILKQIQGVDAVMSGEADIHFGYDPNIEALVTEPITLDGVTRPYEMTPVEACATSISPIITHASNEPWRLDALSLYYFDLAPV